MSGYIIYGKILRDCTIGTSKHEANKTFRALDKYGVRVTRLKDAYIYPTKEEAEERIRKANEKFGYEEYVKFEVRKAK